MIAMSHPKKLDTFRTKEFTMKDKKIEKVYNTLVSDSFGNEQERGTYEVFFRLWVVREINAPNN